MCHVLHGSIRLVIHCYSLLEPSHLQRRFFLSGFWIPVEVLVLKNTVSFCRSFWPPNWFDGRCSCPVTFIDAHITFFSLLVVLLPVLALVRKRASFWKWIITRGRDFCLCSHHNISSKWSQFGSFECPTPSPRQRMPGVSKRYDSLPPRSVWNGVVFAVITWKEQPYHQDGLWYHDEYALRSKCWQVSLLGRSHHDKVSQ